MLSINFFLKVHKSLQY